MTLTHTDIVSHGRHDTLAAVRRVGTGAVVTLLAGLLVLATTVSGVAAVPLADTPSGAESLVDPFLEATAIQDPAERADAFSAMAEIDPGSEVSEGSYEAMLWAIKEAMVGYSD